jgi:hypothetical protein
MKKIIRFLGKTMSENPKCHLQIPQPKKGIYGCMHYLMVHFRQTQHSQKSQTFFYE